MTHATPEEVHDHAYGFHLSEHVAGCDECGRAADAVLAERETLRNVLEDECPDAPPDVVLRLVSLQPQRRRIAPAALAAAAVLLAALAWLLFQPKAAVDSPGAVLSPPPTQEAEIDRLIAELQRPSPRRQAIAWVALRAYGGLAVEPLKKARAAPALIDECRGITIADQKVIQKLKEKRITVDLADASLVQAVDILRELSGVAIHIYGVDNAHEWKVSLKMDNVSIFQCLERLKETGRMPYFVKDEVVLVGREQPAPVSWAPLRLSLAMGAAKKLAARLEKGASEEQHLASQGLFKLSFSAEPVLWELVGSSDLGVQSHASNLLRKLYERPIPPKPGVPVPLDPNAPPAVRILESLKVDVSFENTQTPEILAYLSGKSGLSILIDPQVDFGQKAVTFRCKDLVIKNTLKLLLSQYRLDYFVGDDWIMVAQPGRVERTRPPGPIWLSPEEAKSAQRLLLDFASADAAVQEKARQTLLETGRPALGWLAHASQVYPGAEAARFAELHGQLADSLKIWIFDQRSGIDLQTLTAAQKAVLDRPMAKGQDVLAKLPVIIRVPGEVRVSGCSTPSMSLGSFLKAITRIQGLDLYMSGDDVVIDTPANVRAFVEQRR